MLTALLSRPHQILPAALLALSAVANAQAPAPTHLYELNGSLADTFGGPSLVANGGTLGASSYSFGVNQGLTLSGALPASVYTIDMSFSIEQTSSYRRLIDFKNGSSDTGVYNLSTALNFYGATTGANGAFTANEMVRLTVSRDASGMFSGYVNGQLQLSFTDSSGLAIFSSPDTLARFFIDDSIVSGEASAGVVDYIAIYDQALSAADIATLNPVPEPQTYALTLGGLAALALIARRRRSPR